MNQRKLSELWQIVASYYLANHKGCFTMGICRAIWRCNLGAENRDRLQKDLTDNKPLVRGNTFQHFKFYNHTAFTGGPYWWEMDADGIEQRIKFMDMLIKKHQDNETKDHV